MMKFWIKGIAEYSDNCNCGRWIQRGEEVWLCVTLVPGDLGDYPHNVLVRDEQHYGSLKCSECIKALFPKKEEGQDD